MQRWRVFGSPFLAAERTGRPSWWQHRSTSSSASTDLTSDAASSSSVLLPHIHCSVPTAARLCREQTEQARQVRQSGSPASARRSVAPIATPVVIPEKDPETPEEGEAVVEAFCAGLGMGLPAMRQWRTQLKKASARRWGPTISSQGRAPPPTCAGPECVEARVSLTEVVLGGEAAGKDLVGQPKGHQYFHPRAQDVTFVQSSLRDLRVVLSPLVTLSPPPASSAAEAVQRATGASARPRSYKDSSSLYATRFIPAGVFIASVPADAVLFAEPPHSSDLILSYFLHIEDLVGQLVAAEEEGDMALGQQGPPAQRTTSGVSDGEAVLPPHYGYVRYLKESIVPARNLPFLARKDIEALVGPCPAEDAGGKCEAAGSTAASSPAWALWSFFHDEMKGEPLSAFLRERLTREEYAWWVSAVLSRREGASMLIPFVDKLNHSVLPNCYYTMSSAQSFCCLDVLDNMMAGVDAELMYQPYVHVCTLRDVQPGEELTLCYSSPADGLYRKASGNAPEPARPAFLNAPPHAAALRRPRPGSDGPAAGEAPAGWQGTWQSLFSSSSLHTSERTDLTPTPTVNGGGSRPSLAGLLHPGKQHVDTPEGRASWTLQWGFTPSSDAIFSESDLREMAALVAEKRVNSRRELFPPSTGR